MKKKADIKPSSPPAANAVTESSSTTFLTESEQKYRTLFESIDEGFCTLKVLFDEKGKAVDYVFLEVNPAFERLTGIRDIVGKKIRELIPNLQNFWIETYGRIASTGEPERFEHRSVPSNNLYDAYAFRIGSPEERKVAVIFSDISQRKKAEENLVFLAEISQELARLTAPDQVIETVGEKVGNYLNLSFCAFAEVDESQNTAIITRDWHRADLPSVSGVYKISEFLTEEFQQTARAGKPLVVRDIVTDSRVDTERYRKLNIGAFVAMPIIHEGVLKFLFVTYHEHAHDWRDDETALVSELTTRIWTRLERLRAEEALRESEEKYRFIVNQATVGIAQTDINNKFIFVNERLCELLGYKCEELIKLGAADVTHPEDFAASLKIFKQSIADKSSFQIEKRYVRKNGELIWVQNSVSPFFDSAGKLLFVQTITLDITDHKRAEEAVRKSEKQLQMVLESTKDYAIVTFDLDGVITRFNSGAENMFGYTEQEIIGRDGAILFTPEDRAANVPQKEMQGALENGGASDERWHLRKDGTRFYASGVMQPLHNGEVEGFVKISRDETQRLTTEKVEREKEMLRRLISSQEDERRRIARDIHDHFGQQMTALRLKLAKLRELNDNARISEEIEAAEEIAASLDSDIDFIAWELRPSSLDDLGLRITLGNFLKEWSHHTGIKSEYHVSGIGERRFTYEIKTNLYRIAQEVLNNIYKHAQADKVEVIFEKRADELLLVIEDNGIGFDVEDKDNRQKGIGLIGIHERAAIIGGASEIESQKGSGTTVFVRVPVKFEDE